MNKDKRCLVNYFSRGRENYQYGSERLVQSSLHTGIDCDMIICSPDLSKDKEEYPFTKDNKVFIYGRMPTTKDYGICKSHNDAPYAFKPYIIQEAIDMGYEKIMWMDSSVVFLKNPEPYWKLAEDIGVVVMDNPGCPEATWTSDDCLEHMGCSVEEARTFWMVSAGLMVLDFSRPVTHDVFNFYMEHSNDDICLKGVSGSTREDFRAHRHDQSILSYACKKYYVHHINYGAWSYFYDYKNGKFNPTFSVTGLGTYYNNGILI